MTKRMLRYRLCLLASIILLGPTLLLVARPVPQMMPAQPPPPPKRLRVTLAKNTLTEGDRTDIVVEFLDRYYKPVPNDKNREIKLKQEVSGSAAGAGDILPERLPAGAGATSLKAQFRARRAGLLKIKASIDGLEDAQALVYITRPSRRSSFLARLFDFTVYAQDERMIFMERIDQEPFLANNVSPVSFDLALVGQIEGDEKIPVEFKTDPLCVVRCDETDAVREDGLVRLNFSKDQQVKRVSLISPARPGPVKVSAQIMPPQGMKKETTVDFKPPTPKSIFFADLENKEISEKRMFSNDQIEPLKIMLADERKVPLGQLTQEYRIHLSSTASDNAAIAFDPDTIILSPTAAAREANLIVRQIPPAGWFNLLAQEDNRQLETSRLKISLVYPIQGVIVSGMKEVNPHKEYTLRIQLTDGTKTPQQSDGERVVQVSAERGQLMATSDGAWASAATVTFQRGEPFAEVKYRAPGGVGGDTISTQSNLPDNGQLAIKVVITTLLLLLWAGVGGLLGGLIKPLYERKVKYIKWAWVKGKLEIGLLGHGLVSIPIGIFIFLATNFGLVKIAQFEATETWAFFLGMAGGLLGVVGLQPILNQIIPAKKAMSAAAGGGN
ncbi:MAG TPA: hypothetical protein VKA60_10645 [Blastocatellia bacterium]|nr:hypothetical protein [Blastocatellia bacterium]